MFFLKSLTLQNVEYKVLVMKPTIIFVRSCSSLFTLMQSLSDGFISALHYIFLKFKKL